MVRIVNRKIDLTKIFEGLKFKGGAVNVFIGVVRPDRINGKVKKIYYEVSRDIATTWLKELLLNAKKNFSLIDAHLIHRYGWVKTGEIAMVVITISKHRYEAIRGAEYIIEKLKKKIPIWKKEVSSSKSIWK